MAWKQCTVMLMAPSAIQETVASLQKLHRVEALYRLCTMNQQKKEHKDMNANTSCEKRRAWSSWYRCTAMTLLLWLWWPSRSERLKSSGHLSLCILGKDNPWFYLCPRWFISLTLLHHWLLCAQWDLVHVGSVEGDSCKLAHLSPLVVTATIDSEQHVSLQLATASSTYLQSDVVMFVVWMQGLACLILQHWPWACQRLHVSVGASFCWGSQSNEWMNMSQVGVQPECTQAPIFRATYLRERVV